MVSDTTLHSPRASHVLSPPHEGAPTQQSDHPAGPAAAPAEGVAPGVADGFALAHATLGPRRGAPPPLEALQASLAAQLSHTDDAAARRAAGRLGTPLTPAHTRHLDARAKALLGAEVGGATGRRWMRDAPPRPGFSAHPGVRACVRALAVAGSPSRPPSVTVAGLASATPVELPTRPEVHRGE